ncbi:kinase-like protein [Penicillium taxi]|uniref:kinase-like protein n=1 Tax=Penicillium taxi TaxID=168475 RepID=UPI002544E983|nr:kinase-like protein [Penicillium taxi]KAJ5893534.1 kinase-like protein [Penicillium taxi]
MRTWTVGQPEVEAMRLILEHTDVPVPEIVFPPNIRPPDQYSEITMTIIPGAPLDRKWDMLDEGAKESICLQLWGLISRIRTISPPEELYQCAADDSPSQDPMLVDL